jgi:hypothetical protein
MDLSTLDKTLKKIINSSNQISDEGASKLGAGLSNLKDLSNLNLYLG